MPMPVMCAWWLACDIPFHYDTEFSAYLPNVQPDQKYVLTYQWMEALVDKMKSDLLAIGCWDRQ